MYKSKKINWSGLPKWVIQRKPFLFHYNEGGRNLVIRIKPSENWYCIFLAKTLFGYLFHAQLHYSNRHGFKPTRFVVKKIALI